MPILDTLSYEKVLLKFLLTDEKIRNKVFPYLTIDIFDTFECKEIAKKIFEYDKKFSEFPSVKELKLTLDNETVYDSLKNIVDLDTKDYRKNFLVDEIEDFFRQKLSFHELASGVEYLKEGKIDNLNDISDKIRQAANFSFNADIGYDPFSDDGFERFWDHLHEKKVIIPTGIEAFDRLIEGGIHKKSVTAFLAESGKGKTLIKCAIAANMILQNKKVLYVTMELSEEYISQRIIQNILDLEYDDLKIISKENLRKRWKKITEKLKSLLIIKKYPQNTIHCGHIRNLLNDLDIKKKFIPQTLIVDYLGILNAVGINKSSNSNDIGKAKCQELQALSYEKDLATLTSAQANRSGYGSAILDPTKIADSIGIFAELDLVVSVTQSSEQRELPIPLFTWFVMKNRFDIDKKETVVGVNYKKMKLINVDTDKEKIEGEVNKKSDVNSATDIIFNSMDKVKMSDFIKTDSNINI